MTRCARDPLRVGFTNIRQAVRWAGIAFFHNLHLYASKLSSVDGIKKQVDEATCLSDVGSGGWIRTNDLRVMSPTSYLCSTPHSVIPLWKSAAKLLLFCDMAK